MRLCLALICALSWAPLAIAQEAPDRLDILQSQWHADRADLHLRQGDRASAILAAMRGIPAEPVTQDEATYSDAFAALFRAVASRAFRSDLLSDQVAIWSPDGTRAVTESSGAAIDSPRQNGAVLWDPVTGTRIAELLPLRGWAEGWNLPTEIAVSPFSPDSRLLALAESSYSAPTGFEGRILLVETAAGAPLGEVPGDSFMGFSNDGALFLAKSLYSDEVRLYETATLQEVGRLTSGEVGGDVIVSGHPDATGGFTLALTSWGDGDGLNARARLARMDRAGTRIIADVSALPGLSLGGSWPIAQSGTDSGNSVLTTGSGEVFVIDPEGRLTGRIEGYYEGYGRLAFVRNGQAIAMIEGYAFEAEDFAELRVFDLTGAPLAPEPMDVVPFLDWVTDAQGRVLGMTFVGTEIGAGRTTAHGIALYAEIWPQIPEAIREAIEVERIIRAE
jgi:hypothetical protein